MIRALCMAAILATAMPGGVARAADPSPPPGEVVDEAAELARRAAERLVDALRAVVDRFPYAAPEITDNGDIIIRRRQPAAEPPPPADPDAPIRTRADGAARAG